MILHQIYVKIVHFNVKLVKEIQVIALYVKEIEG